MRLLRTLSRPCPSVLGVLRTFGIRGARTIASLKSLVEAPGPTKNPETKTCLSRRDVDRLGAASRTTSMPSSQKIERTASARSGSSRGAKLRGLVRSRSLAAEGRKACASRGRIAPPSTIRCDWAADQARAPRRGSVERRGASPEYQGPRSRVPRSRKTRSPPHDANPHRAARTSASSLGGTKDLPR